MHTLSIIPVETYVIRCPFIEELPAIILCPTMWTWIVRRCTCKQRWARNSFLLSMRQRQRHTQRNRSPGPRKNTKICKASLFKWSSHSRPQRKETQGNIVLAWNYGHVVAAVLSRAQLYLQMTFINSIPWLGIPSQLKSGELIRAVSNLTD